MELVLPLMEPESQAQTPRENALHDDGIVQDLRRHRDWQTPMSQGVTSRRREGQQAATGSAACAADEAAAICSAPG